MRLTEMGELLQNVVELLDDLFQRAANADEPEGSNFIRQVSAASFQAFMSHMHKKSKGVCPALSS